MVDNLISEGQTRLLPTRIIHGNLHLMRTNIERLGNESVIREDLINIDRSKAFDKKIYHE